MPIPVARLQRGRFWYLDADLYKPKPDGLVLKDRTTGTLYRLTSVSGVLTPVSVAGLSTTDKQLDPLGAQTLDSPPVRYVVFIQGGTLSKELVNTESQPGYVKEGATTYLIYIDATGTVALRVVTP